MFTSPHVLGQGARLAAVGGGAPDATNMTVDAMIHSKTSCMLAIIVSFVEPIRWETRRYPILYSIHPLRGIGNVDNQYQPEQKFSHSLKEGKENNFCNLAGSTKLAMGEFADDLGMLLRLFPTLLTTCNTCAGDEFHFLFGWTYCSAPERNTSSWTIYVWLTVTRDKS